MEEWEEAQEDKFYPTTGSPHIPPNAVGFQGASNELLKKVLRNH